jgi:hypothetical protein
MSANYYAFCAIDLAVARTKNILIPIKRGVWLRLALIAFFVGGSFGGFETTWQENHSFPQSIPAIDLACIGPELLTIFAAIIAFGLCYALLSGIFQFIFFDAIREDKIVIKQYFSREIGNGLRYFCFVFAISVIFFTLLALPAALILSGAAPGGMETSAQRASLVIGYVAYVLALVIPYLVIVMFTTDFVIPIMRLDNCGILAGWKRCFMLFRGRRRQAVVYTGMKILFLLVMGIIVGILVGITAVLFGIPVFLLAAATGWAPIGIGPYSVIFAVYLSSVVFLGLLFSVPFITFFRCYSLYVLGYLDQAYGVFDGTATSRTGDNNKDAN